MTRLAATDMSKLFIGLTFLGCRPIFFHALLIAADPFWPQRATLNPEYWLTKGGTEGAQAGLERNFSEAMGFRTGNELAATVALVEVDNNGHDNEKQAKSYNTCDERDWIIHKTKPPLPSDSLAAGRK
jgi:hypothetical protein